TSSAICWIDGDRGILSYCGFDIHDLAQHATFEEVCFLLWHRRLPTRAELGDLQTQLAEARILPEPIVRLLNQLPYADGMRLLLELGADATPERIESTIRGKLAKKEKIPGFGHRVYHTEDPRATHLRRMSKALGAEAGEPRWYAMSERIEALVKGEK